MVFFFGERSPLEPLVSFFFTESCNFSAFVAHELEFPNWSHRGLGPGRRGYDADVGIAVGGGEAPRAGSFTQPAANRLSYHCHPRQEC